MAAAAKVLLDASETNLFKPIKVGNVELKNRLVHAPTVRFRSDKNGTATDSMLEYFTSRAKDNGGLLIIESTTPNPRLGVVHNTTTLETESQVKSFKKIVDSVHAEGSSICLQLIGFGRASVPADLARLGIPYLAPSAIYWDKETEIEAKAAGIELKEMTTEDVEFVIKSFVEAATKAVHECGFDFIEIHAAHGYLLEQFIQESSNKRTDKYGGSIENRARVLLEIIDGCIEAVGAERVGFRLSPYAIYQNAEGRNARINPIVTYGYILSELQRRVNEGKKLAYLSFVEPRVSGNSDNESASDVDSSWIGKIWLGPIITSGNHLSGKYINNLPSVVNRDDRTLIGVGRYYTSNPDLVSRLRSGYELTPYDRSTFYTNDNVGYLTFPRYGEEPDHSKDDLVPVALA